MRWSTQFAGYSRGWSRWFSWTVVFAGVGLAACAGPIERADKYMAQDEWVKAVMEIRGAATRHPGNVEYRSRLKQTEQKAADHYYQQGVHLLEQDNLDAAILQFQQGLAAMPDHGKLLQAMSQALARKEANALYDQAVNLLEAGKKDEGRQLLSNVLEMNPDHKRAAALIGKYDKSAIEEEALSQLALSSRAPITLNFRQTDLRTAFEFLAKSFGVDVIFDEAIKTQPVTLFAKDATFEQALNLMLVTTKTFYKRVGPNTVLIAPDTKEKRGQYEDHVVRSFHLSSIRAKEMADIIKGLVNVKKLIINDSLNSLVVRDTDDVVKIVDRIIQANDRRAAELLMEVEILEVNRTKAERLGLDLGSYRVTTQIPASATIPVTGNIREAIRSAMTLTLPSAAFNFYKQDVDAKILANPKVRVLSGKNAKIHIGDRIPLRGSSIQNVGGFVSTTYEYKDIGIRLITEPVVHLDNSVTVKVNLEVSTLGENLGTTTEPAYRIGTRNAETFMLLRDGETAILGGLIRDEDRATTVRLPGIGDIPAVGLLFASADDNKTRTDVLLTITPRVVRGWDLPAKNDRAFVSGTEDRYISQPLFAKLNRPILGAPNANELKTRTDVPAVDSATTPTTSAVSPIPTPAAAPAATVASDQVPAAAPAPAVTPGTIPATEGTPSAPTTKPATTSEAPAAAVASAAPYISGKPALFAFSEAAYEGATGRSFEIALTAENLAPLLKLPMEILFNPQLLKLVRGEAGNLAATSKFKVEADESRGVIRVVAEYPGNKPVSGTGVIARLTLEGKRPGVSYLVYRTPEVNTTDGQPLSAQVRASRVVIK